MNKLLCKVCGEEDEIINIISNRGACKCGSTSLLISVHRIDNDVTKLTKKDKINDEPIDNPS